MISGPPGLAVSISQTSTLLPGVSRRHCVCAQVKLLDSATEPGSIANFLGKAVEPPVGPAVDHAITLLQVQMDCNGMTHHGTNRRLPRVVTHGFHLISSSNHGNDPQSTPGLYPHVPL